ncbi:MAG: trehalose-6-phosphate synthase [Deltaproteobacteria bacterium]|nr:trehalose-6-phosphate synthase [Deltaproteobacteria bacterium]
MMEDLLNKKLIIVSNREPYSIRKGAKAEKTVGGLVAALDPVMQSSRGVWIASGTKEDEANGTLRCMVPPGKDAYELRKVPLTHGDIEGYYNGYSNRFLWPLCHYALDKVYLARSYWNSYKKVNRLFSDAVIEEAGRDKAIVWLQDYHLSLCAAEIKARRPAVSVSLFWHIPWPPYDVFKACPQRREVLEGLLANDLLGFQLEHYKHNFMRCVDREMDEAEVDYENGLIFRGNHATSVKSFPISVDFNWFDSTAREPSTDAFFKRFMKKRGMEGQILGLGVNRLDYTKGLLKCLDAIEYFFTRNPRYRGRMTFVQVAVPTRRVEPYISYMERVRKRVNAVNNRFRKGGWQPVEYIEGNLQHRELAALYKHASVAIISSVYDGMNLVAKEYIASQVNKGGSILVSEFAGAAEEIPGITVINPYDTASFGDAIKTALERRPAERKTALQAARAHIRQNDIYKWVDDIVREFRKLG